MNPPFIDPLDARPWDDVEMRFAMMSVIIGAKIWHAKPDDPDAADLLRRAVELCDLHLAAWEERNAL